MAVDSEAIGPTTKGAAVERSGEPGGERTEPWVRAMPYGIAVVAFVLYTWVSLRRQVDTLSTGFDLGIFDQVVRSYSHWGAPIVLLKGPGFNILGDHFSPILATLAPIYHLFPNVDTLLVAQAALLAVSIVPVTQWASKALGPGLGAAIGASYGLSWGLQRAVGFDFHEVAFAVPLLAFSARALLERRYTAAVAWAVPLLIVKEDLPLTVAAIGAYLFLVAGRRLLGGVLAAVGVAAFGLITFVIIPAFNTGHAYMYSDSYLPHSLSDLGQGWPTKLTTLVLLLAPTAFLAVRSPLIMLIVPTLAWRFVSTNPSHWQSYFHYDAVLMPILFLAFAQALTTAPWPLVRRGVVAAATVFALIYTVSLPIGQTALHRDPADVARANASRAVLALIPDGASVASSNQLVPQLVDRTDVFLFPVYPTQAVRTEWVVVRLPDVSPRPLDEILARQAELASLGYQIVQTSGDVVLYRLSSSSPVPPVR